MAGIDYGVVVFQNGNQLYGDQLYPDVEFGPLKIACYKARANFSINKSNVLWLYGLWEEQNPGSEYRKSTHFKIGEYAIHVKEVVPSVYRIKCSKDGQHLTIIYGYGIDPNWKVWNKIKVRYLGKYRAGIVDREIRKAASEDLKNGTVWLA